MENLKMDTIEYNHAFVYNFWLTFGGDAFAQTDDLNGKWIIKIHDEYFDENGVIKNIILTGPKIDEYMNTLDVPSNDYNLANKIETLYDEHNSRVLNTILTESKRVLGYAEINSIDDNVYIITLNNQDKILRLLPTAYGNLSDIMNTYVKFSKLGITPQIHFTHFFYPGEPYTGSLIHSFFVSDYYPLTLNKIENASEREQAIKQAIELAYFIEKLGYYNQDLHRNNFLYDDINKKVYAIDFESLNRDSGNPITQDRIIHLMTDYNQIYGQQ